MSSDTFSIRVMNVDQDKVEFLCITSTAGGISDYACTRSFALMIIEDGMPYASGGKGTPLQLELRKLAGSDSPPVWEKKFHQEHVHKFIVKSTLVERASIVMDEAAWRRGRPDDENETDYPLHRFVLHVQVTDPKWLIGLNKDSPYGTTAFDAWWDDPTRQSAKELAEIERNASKWTGPGQITAVKKAAPAKKAAKKAAPAKKAAKKAAR